MAGSNSSAPPLDPAASPTGGRGRAKRDWKPEYTRAELTRLQTQHVHLTNETRTLYGGAAHSVLLHRGVRHNRSGTQELLHVYDQSGQALEPLPGMPAARLIRLLEALLELHELGHWLLDDTLVTSRTRAAMPQSRPIAPRAAPPQAAYPDLPWR
ncbi:hypothetical protein [Deinococcus soli (ex Cha et al. 2016)]|uniref:hypothetical protein n=1 Tax=Deinococcus soli (ex Cha et al. 2016) TaxID=1309411 RepID=UPI00166EE285|nr:hypothetical protein [Deinococcus soli (ex Cha et al. 2016)]GGB79389.1 hypothetical protein GCM10008019_39520 [Deinococcus soli (ex Cha et al. 2016)]